MLAQKEEKSLRKVTKEVKIDGFRAGKVPTKVVKDRYGAKIEQDAQQEALNEVFTEALKVVEKDANLVVGEPQITKYEKKDDGIEVEVKISFKPEVHVEGYEKCIPEYSTPKVTKKEIAERLEKILAMSAPLKKVEESRALKSGDTALFDFEGFIDGEAFEGGKAENYLLEIGSNQFIPGFEDGMVGMSAGESKDVHVVFPAEYGAAHLAGKDATFKVKLHEIQIKDISETPDEELLKRLLPNEENPSAEKLDEKIKEQIKSEKLSKLFNEDLKPKFIEQIVEVVNFDLPENIVEQEIDLQFRSQWQNFSEEQIEEFKNTPEKVQEKREEIRDDATKSVKLTFIVDELAKAQGISVTDQEVMQAIYFEALQQGQDPKQHLELYKNQGVLPAVKMAMIEDKLFNKLFSKDEK